MALTESIREDSRKVPAPCIHCARGWVYEVDEETGEDVAIPCWMGEAGRS